MYLIIIQRTTAQIAIKNGAIVHYVKKQGKGNVVKAMFRDIDADYYIMIDGDGTYSAHNISVLLETVITNRVDMLIGNRLVQYENSASRKNYLTGNKIITQTVNFYLNLTSWIYYQAIVFYQNVS